jgi:hypothetical protein
MAAGIKIFPAVKDLLKTLSNDIHKFICGYNNSKEL